MTRLDHFEISVKYMLGVPVDASCPKNVSTGPLRVTLLVSHLTHFTVLTFFKRPNETLVASLALLEPEAFWHPTLNGMM